MSGNGYLFQVPRCLPDQDCSEMLDSAKEQYGNTKWNYMAALGLKPTMREFMKSKPVALKAVAQNSAESRTAKQQLNKSADTAQAPQTGANGKENSGGVKLAPRKKTWTAPVKDRAVGTDNMQLAAGAATDQKSAVASDAGYKRPDDSDGESANKKFSSTDSDSPGVIRYPRQQWKEVNDVECEKVPDEEYLFCEDCTMNYPGVCPLHGPLTQVKDTPSQQILVAFVRLGAMCYRLCKVVDATEKLVVWDEDDFAKQLDLISNAGTQNRAAEVDVAAPSEVFSCEECGDQFTEKQLLENHRRRKHMQRPQQMYQCAHCPYSSNNRSHVTRHERVHTGERPFVCHVCDRGFSERGNLNRHLLVHTGEKPHECPDCGQRFTQASHMATHRRLQHSTQSARRYVCPECGKGFTLRGHLTTHLLTHTGEKPHACSKCGMAFAQRSNARKHEQIVHTRQYPLHCPHCGKGFVKTNDLRRHVSARHRDEDDDDKENDEDH